MTSKDTSGTSFVFNKQEILEAVAKIPRPERASYPDHLFEPERIEVIRELVLKEQYKLYPHFDTPDFDKLNSQMLGWLVGHGYELAPVADFWNFMDGFMISLKLKDIAPILTSQNIEWRLEELDPKDLVITAEFEQVSKYCQKPYNYETIQAKILSNPEALAENIRISDEKSAHTKVNRDNLPIIVRRSLEGKLTLYDGNRRVLRAWLKNWPKVQAWVGTVKAEPALKNYWVATPFLRRLLSLYAHNKTPEMAQAIRTQLKFLFENSTIAVHHYKERCIPHYDFAAELADGLLE